MTYLIKSKSANDAGLQKINEIDEYELDEQDDEEKDYFASPRPRPESKLHHLPLNNLHQSNSVTTPYVTGTIAIHKKQLQQRHQNRAHVTSSTNLTSIPSLPSTKIPAETKSDPQSVFKPRMNNKGKKIKNINRTDILTGNNNGRNRGMTESYAANYNINNKQHDDDEDDDDELSGYPMLDAPYSSNTNTMTKIYHNPSITATSKSHAHIASSKRHHMELQTIASE